MKEEKDLFEQFKDKDRSLGEKPSVNAWNKLEAKLDEHQMTTATPVVPLQPRLKWLQIAAGLAVLIGALTLLRPQLESALQPNNMSAGINEDFILEDLDYSQPSGFYALAIQSTRYYHTSPSKLAEGDHEQRLRITDRKTRTAKQPMLAMSKAKKVSKSASATAKEAIGRNNSSHESNHESSHERRENSKDENRDEQVVNQENTYGAKRASSAPASKVVADAELAEHSAVKITSVEADDINHLDAYSNSMSFESSSVSNVDVDYFNWLIGNWKAPFAEQKTNIQNWEQKDKFTLSGQAKLNINGEEILVENMEIKKIGNQLYFIRVNTAAGETIKYELTSINSGVAVFSNAVLNDQFSLKQNAVNNFSQQTMPSGALQISQFPGTPDTKINFTKSQQ